MTSFSSLHFVCFGEETWNCMHFLVILSLKTLWAGRTPLLRFYLYRKPLSSPRSRNLKVIQKCVLLLKCICVWCLDNWSRILSGNHFNTFSMARLNIAISSNPHSPFHCHACIFFFHHFFHDLWLGYFFLFSWPSIYVSYWFTVICEILKNVKFYFPWIVIWMFFYFLRFVTKTPPPFLSFRLWKRCSK